MKAKKKKKKNDAQRCVVCGRCSTQQLALTFLHPLRFGGGVGKDTFSSSDRKTSLLALASRNPILNGPNLDTFYWHTVWLAMF